MSNHESLDLDWVLIGDNANGKLADHFAWNDGFGATAIECALHAVN